MSARADRGRAGSCGSGSASAIVAYILAGVDRGDLRASRQGCAPRTSWPRAAVVFLAGQVLSAFKWADDRALGRASTGRIADYVRFYFVGMFFNLFGPSTIGGDVVRALYLGEGARPGLAFNSVLFDRLSGLVVLVAIGAVALLAFPQYAFPWPLTAATVAVGIALVVGWWACPAPRPSPAASRNRVRRQVEDELAAVLARRRLLRADRRSSPPCSTSRRWACSGSSRAPWASRSRSRTASSSTRC